MSYSYVTLALLAAFISFLGWLLENTWLAFTKNYIDNRGMSLPFLLGYGLLMVAFFLILGTPDTMPFQLPNASRRQRIFLYFAITMILVSVGEIILGTFVEKAFGFHYWNYERLPLHITKYTSIPTSCGFAFIITFFMDRCIIPICDFLSRFESTSTTILALTLGIALSLDFFHAFHSMHQNHCLNQKWKYEVHHNSNQDYYHENNA